MLLLLIKMERQKSGLKKVLNEESYVFSNQGKSGLRFIGQDGKYLKGHLLFRSIRAKPCNSEHIQPENVSTQILVETIFPE